MCPLIPFTILPIDLRQLENPRMDLPIDVTELMDEDDHVHVDAADSSWCLL